MLHESFRSWLGELENLVFPQSCAGCGKWDTALCPSCSEEIGGQWSPVAGSMPALSRVIPASELRSGQGVQGLPGDSRLPFPLWCLGRYQGARRNAIIYWKNQRNREVTARISSQLRQRGRELAPIFVDNKLSEIALVPAPSRPQRKKDGLFVVGYSAQALCEGLREGGVQARVYDVLTIDKRVSTRHAKAGAISCSASPPPDVPIVLVDDVLVTGSTIAGCAHALERHKARVCCVLVLAQRERERG